MWEEGTNELSVKELKEEEERELREGLSELGL